MEELYDTENKPSEEEIPLEEFIEEDMQGPTILFSEFEAALIVREPILKRGLENEKRSTPST